MSETLREGVERLHRPGGSVYVSVQPDPDAPWWVEMREQVVCAECSKPHPCPTALLAATARTPEFVEPDGTTTRTDEETDRG